MSIAMYDAMKTIESKLLYVIMISWIRVSFLLLNVILVLILYI